MWCKDTPRNDTLILEVLSRFWELSLPVLLVKMLEDVVKLTTAPLPLSMGQAGIQRLTHYVVQMWWPTCLLPLTKTFLVNQEEKHLMDPYVTEQTMHKSMATRHRALRAAGVPVLLISYADLLWRPDRTLSRLRSFVPCTALDRVSTDAELMMGLDVFPGNKWKVNGTVRGFASRHPPSSLGYVEGRCLEDAKYTTNKTIEEYLRAFS